MGEQKTKIRTGELTIMWNQESECLPREALEALQLERLRDLLRRLVKAVPFYRQALETQGIRADDGRSHDDLSDVGMKQMR